MAHWDISPRIPWIQKCSYCNNVRRARLLLLFAQALAAGAPAYAPHERPQDTAGEAPGSAVHVLFYRVKIDTADLTTVRVEMHIRGGAGTFRVAMAAHPEYDDRFWRFLDRISVAGPGGAGSVTRLDSALWLVRTAGGESVLRYSIRIPAPPQARRAAWRPFLSKEGGLTGGIQTFVYVVGAPPGPSRVTLDIPPGWDAATGLEPTDDPRTFIARSAAILLDSPILTGHIRTWRFAVDGVPHRIAYLPLPGSGTFDTTALATGIARLAGEAEKVFGGLPYREYTFILEEGAYGALEHLNSLTLGFSGSEFAKDPRPLYGSLAHEYFHTWNLMRLRPAELRGISYTPPPPTRVLWWSEGITMMFADILLRRAGLPIYDSTRGAHLAGGIESYAGDPGNSLISPEDVSLVAFAPPGGLGDYSASTHLQGELLGTMIDLIIRDATGGKKSIDDLMRELFIRFPEERGFTEDDIENTASGVCGCDMRSFFATYVRAAHGIDFNRYLELIGLRIRLTWGAAVDAGGMPEPDLRAYAWQQPGMNVPVLGITWPGSCWGRAGLHTGDIITAVNGTRLTTAGDFRTLLTHLHTGDTVVVDVRRSGDSARRIVVVTSYERPGVSIEEIPGATGTQRALRRRWESCTP
jgi:predicted metalloprotease with PDZ domain